MSQIDITILFLNFFNFTLIFYFLMFLIDSMLFSFFLRNNIKESNFKIKHIKSLNNFNYLNKISTKL